MNQQHHLPGEMDEQLLEALQHMSPLEKKALKYEYEQLLQEELSKQPWKALEITAEKALVTLRKRVREQLEYELSIGKVTKEQVRNGTQNVEKTIRDYRQKSERVLYQMPKAYHPYEDLLNRCQVESYTNLLYMLGLEEEEGEATRRIHEFFLQWLHDYQPMVSLTSELLIALLSTEPPQEVVYGEVRWPYPFWTVAIPKGLLKTAEGFDVTYVFVQTTTPKEFEDQEHIVQAPQLPEEDAHRLLDIRRDNIFCIHVVTEGPCYYRSEGPKQDQSIAEFMEVEHVQAGELSESEDQMICRVTSLVFNIGLFFMACPEDFEEASLCKTRKGKKIPGKKKKREQSIEIWTPNMLGRSYTRLEREDGEGSHASPRVHWRRPHWHRYRVGKGRKDTQLKWVNRILVKSGEDT